MNSIHRNRLRRVVAGLAVGFVGLQFIQPDLQAPPQSSKHILPPAVEAIVKKSCYDCHSNQTQLAWFDQIAPASWLVASHVRQGRKAFNFSQWEQLPPADQKAKLYQAVNDILAGEMPLPSYLTLHPKAKVTDGDIKVLKQYLLKLAPRSLSTTASLPVAAQSREIVDGVVNGVRPAPNGIRYLPGYRNWQVISTTDRFDNATLRVIYGNAVAVKAIAQHQINPWPDGAVLAKVAWSAQPDTAGVIHPGRFLQVEFMIKDRRQYAATNGWGWARWKGAALTPYGQTKLFTTECTSCHRPMKDNDFVFTLPLHLTKN